jgi:anti-sigma regulatory factor (Ser/Thr protein kinase)
MSLASVQPEADSARAHAMNVPFSLPAPRSGKATPEELRLTIRNEIGELARASALAREHLGRHGLEEEVVYAVDLALEEVVSNVIRHAYDDGDRHEIGIALRIVGRRVEIQIADDGREFDPVSAPAADVDVPLERRRIGGLGIHLLRAFVSEMHYERLEDRNVLSLRI